MPSMDDLYASDLATKVLLICGALAGPFFTFAWIVEGAARSDYNPLRHPISSLSIGAAGWMQSTAFLVTGLLMLACAFGLRRVPGIRAGSTWGPILIGAIGIGFFGAGMFVTDPMNGYPPGTPDLLLQYSLTGRLHRLFSALVFLGLPGACFVFARLFNLRGERKWSLYSRATGIAFLLMFIVTSAGFAKVPGLVNYAGLFQRITLTIGWVWLTLLPISLLKAPKRN
jgi:uncharacterized protein DUF998